ncbi:MAG: nucleotidyltransferase family protein [Gemmatimonadota bacterium]
MKSSSASPWALILAAGESRRFGSQKLLAPLHGRPLIGWTMAALETARARGLVGGVLVVVRAKDHELRQSLQPGVDRVVRPAGSAPALSDSLRAGIAALASRDTPVVPAVLICLADQPGLRPDVIAALVNDWRSGKGLVLRPRYADQPDEPGHPLLLDRSAWPMVETLQGDVGLGAALKGGDQPVHYVEVAGGNPDIDRPGDLVAVQNRPG